MLLTDKEISKLAELDIFTPYVGEKCRTLDDGTKAISYGLSQAGYDIRLSPKQFLVFDGKSLKGPNKPTLCPKMSDPTVPFEAPLVHCNDGSYFVLPPQSFGLGVSLELISMPRRVWRAHDGKDCCGQQGWSPGKA